MSIFLIVTIIILLSLILITLLHIRVRLSIHSERKTLFIGLGHTGILTNYNDRTRSILIAGRTIRTSAIVEKKTKAEPKVEKPRKKSTRTRAISDIVAIIPGSFGAVRKYFVSIVKSIIVEEFEVEVNAALPEPHLTGMAFGLYQAGVAAFPDTSKHFKFTPDWDGDGVSGSLKTTASIPLYKIIYRITVLVFQLPLRKLVKLAIGRKDRKSNVTAK